MLNEQKKKILIRTITIVSVIILFIVVCMMMLKYEVEGETNMPFKLTKISIISTANGIPNSETMDRWNFNLVQNNDIYFNLEKNEDYNKQESIKKVSLENIRIIQTPEKGVAYFYRPNKEAADWYENVENCRITENITYEGQTKSNVKELQISNQGGIIGFRFAIEDLGTYISEEEQITHDGMLLKEIGITQQEIQSKIGFDLILELNSGIKYKAYIEQVLPLIGVLEEGISKQENTELKEVVFKRF